MSEVLIDPRFHGPPHSANGGYACGMVAEVTDAAVEVSLRVPPPLGRPLHADRTADGGVRLLDGETLVAEATPTAPPTIDVPADVDLDAAREAVRGYVGFHDHPFPTCWTCGPERVEGDGLRIFTGPVDGASDGVPGLVAAPWIPHDELEDGGGAVTAPHVWAALDCPSYFGAASPDPALLARMRADLRAPVRVGRPHVVLGWTTAAADGRKRHGGSAVLDADGTVLAVAETLWVTLSPDALAALLDPA